MIQYRPQGVCASNIEFEIIDGRVHKVSFQDGCNGNLKAISILVEGMGKEELIAKLKGVRCGRKSTSCADQLAKAVERTSIA